MPENRTGAVRQAHAVPLASGGGADPDNLQAPVMPGARASPRRDLRRGFTPVSVSAIASADGRRHAGAHHRHRGARGWLLTILTIRETAGRPLPQGVADEMFQSNADVRGAATPG